MPLADGTAWRTLNLAAASPFISLHARILLLRYDTLYDSKRQPLLALRQPADCQSRQDGRQAQFAVYPCKWLPAARRPPPALARMPTARMYVKQHPPPAYCPPPIAYCFPLAARHTLSAVRRSPPAACLLYSAHTVHMPTARCVMPTARSRCTRPASC